MIEGDNGWSVDVWLPRRCLSVVCTYHQSILVESSTTVPWPSTCMLGYTTSETNLGIIGSSLKVCLVVEHDWALIRLHGVVESFRNTDQKLVRPDTDSRSHYES